MADVPISAFPAAAAITGTELVPVVQGGVTRRTTVNAVETFLAAFYDAAGAAAAAQAASAPVGSSFVTTAADGGLSAETPIGSIILAPDTHANRPAANTVPAGALYFETDTHNVFRSTGAAWVDPLSLSGTYAPIASPTFTGVATTPILSASGNTGATSGSRFAGAVAGPGVPTSGTYIAGDWIIDKTGNVWICTTGGTPGTWTSVGSQAIQSARIATGQETIPRVCVNSGGITTASQRLICTMFTARKTETVSQITAYSGPTAAGATPTLVKLGLFTVAANGVDVTLIGVTASDTSLFASANTAYTRSFASAATASIVAGQRYAIGILVVTGAALPTYPGLTPSSIGNTIAFEAPVMCGLLGSQSDMPALNATVTLTAGSTPIYAEVLP